MQNLSDMMGMKPEQYRNTGIIFLILGFMGIMFHLFLSSFVVYMIGFLLIMGGVVLAISGERSGWLRWGMIIVFFAMGMLVIFNPVPTILAIALLMGVFFLITGLMKLFIGLTNMKEGGILLVINGGISLLLAGMVLAGWPYDAGWMVGLFVGISLVFEGIALMTMGKQIEMGGAGAAGA